VYVSKPFFFSIPGFLLGMFFWSCLSLKAQTTVKGQFPDAIGGMVEIATYEGYQSTFVGKVQIAPDGQFMLFFPKLSYSGFYLFEVDAANGAPLLRFPIWLTNTDLQVSGNAIEEYESLQFSDPLNNFFQLQAIVINAHHNRLEWLETGTDLYTKGKLQQAITKQRTAELANLRKLYVGAMAKAPNDSLRQAITFRFQTDPYLTPLPPFFDAQLLNRINWQHPHMYHDPLVAEYITSLFRHYLFHPSTLTTSLQIQFIFDFTWALHSAFENAGPLRASVLDLMAEGYKQIEAWDALALVDSMRGQSTARITQETQVNWRSETWKGAAVSSQDFDSATYLLVFWSPLCDHCNEQLPVWANDRRLLAKAGIQMVGVAMDPDYLKRQTPQPEAAVFDVLLLDKDIVAPDGKKQSIADAFAFSGTPAYFLMAPGNRVAQRFPNWAAVKAFLAREMNAADGPQKP
jgi:hypothetical protein